MGVYFSRTCPRYFTLIYIITNKWEIFIFAIFSCLVKMRPCKVSLCYFWHFNLNQINLQLPGNISIYYYSKKLYRSLSFYLKVIHCYRGKFIDILSSDRCWLLWKSINFVFPVFTESLLTSNHWLTRPSISGFNQKIYIFMRENISVIGKYYWIKEFGCIF